jgi:hypothetical protein
MSQRSRYVSRRRFLQAQVTLLVPMITGGVSDASAAGLVVVPIVAPDSPLRDIGLGTLERIFLARPVDGPNGKRFVPFNHPAKTLIRMLFDERVLGMSPDEVARHWVDQRIRGNVRAPRAVANVALLKQVVGRFPGAISYLPVGDLDDSVRPLKVGGVDHASDKYVIRG